jgi:hypothetical protein
MYTQSRTKAVPYGFICGYPVGGVSSELYGYYEGQGGKGGRQGEAVVEAMRKWGEGEAGTAGGTELGFAVCKRGYKPFGEDGERMYGCARHTHLRLEAMEQTPPVPKKGSKGSAAAAAAASAAAAAASTSAVGAGAGADGGKEGLYHRPGWERFDQWVFGEKICVSSSSEQTSEDDEEDDDDDDDQAASPTKAAKAS